MTKPRRNPQYNMRIPPDLKAAIEAAAKASGRSLNPEINRRLEASFRMKDFALTLRDQFAMHVAGAMVVAATRKLGAGKEITWAEVADASYYLADAMLEAREKKL